MIWQAYLSAVGRRDLEPLLSDVMVLGVLQRTVQFHAQAKRFRSSVPNVKPHGVPIFLRRVFAWLESPPLVAN